MSDDPSRAAPEQTPPKLTVAQERAQRVEAARSMLARGYSPAQVIDWLESPAIDKTWTVRRTSARKYVNEALEAMDGEVVQPKNRKQARVRAMLTMAFQRAIELAHDPKHVGKAAGLLTAAIAAADKIARVDGSYAFDGSSMIPASTGAASAEDAARLVAHAQGLLELATRRGAMPQVAAGPPVIDATAVEVDEPEDELMDPGEDAN